MAEAYLAYNVFLLEHRLKMVKRRRILRNRRNNQKPLHLEEGEFLRLFRVSKKLFAELVEELRPHLQRRRPYGLSVECQILTTLRFYASGCYQLPIGLQWGSSISQKSVSRVIRQVTYNINQHLLRKHIKFPVTQSEREYAKHKFMHARQPFPQTLGAIDCTHINILAPKVHEEAYVNGHHKGHSLNVQCICDPDLFILNINAKWPGSRHDAHIWANSPVRKMMKQKFEDGDRHSWLLGDDGYSLEPWLMTPIKNQPIGTPEHRYTEALCSARNAVERCFGVLKSTFRCLSRQRQLMYAPNIAGQIVNACAVLHNMRLKYRLKNLQPEELITTHTDYYNDTDEDLGLTGRSVAERIRRRLVINRFS